MVFFFFDGNSVQFGLGKHALGVKMSVEAQLTAILRNQADQTSTKQLDDFLSILNQNQVLSVLNLVQTFIDTLYHTQKFTFDWIKLITALLRCSNTRHETFLLLIKKIQADAFPGTLVTVPGS